MKNIVHKASLLLFTLLAVFPASWANDGSRLWLDYRYVEDYATRESYLGYAKAIYYTTATPTIKVAAGELSRAMSEMLLAEPVLKTGSHIATGGVVLGFAGDSPVRKYGGGLAGLGDDAYRIVEANGLIYIVGNTDKGALYATFHPIRLMQVGRSTEWLDITEST